MNHYTATAEEARAFLSGEKTAIIVPMEPQPSLYASKWHEKLGIKSPSRMAQLWATLPPFQPGQRVGIKEPWGITYLGTDGVVHYMYESDGVYMTIEGWRSSETMPDEAIRQWFVPEKVEARKVQTLIFAENEKIYPYTEGIGVPGEECGLARMWNERCPQYPYDSNPWVWYAEGKVEE